VDNSYCWLWLSGGSGCSGSQSPGWRADERYDTYFKDGNVTLSGIVTPVTTYAAGSGTLLLTFHTKGACDICSACIQLSYSLKYTLKIGSAFLTARFAASRSIR
jgi:hypothetical protein